MTKNRKIKLLINDNRRLLTENKKLHELNNEEISRKMAAEIGSYTDIIEKLNDKYIELEKLRISCIKNRWKYRIMLFSLNVRKMFRA
ncbi:hypothetical protein D7V86_25410 [bacterium D16-51]|nr:hypothetical protein D7V96_25015 [bacterium D16-59]RKI53103.1 hypothetical protein D7V86_25410 [bacterium D16-51]